MKIVVIILLSIISISCNSQKENNSTGTFNEHIYKSKAFQIGEYVTSAYQDTKGNLWFGTLSKGIARYDGKDLKYLSNLDGLPTDRITGVMQDPDGLYWFKTGNGLSSYDGQSFTNYKVNDNAASNMVGPILIDDKGTFWIGTWDGVYTYDGDTFTHFPLPYPEVTTPINPDTKDWITNIKEDKEGNIWITRDGYGACIYNGKSFTHLLKKDGLHSNNITVLEFHQNGDAWIGTRVAEQDNPDPSKRSGKGGVNKMYDGKIISFPEIEPFNNSDVHEIYISALTEVWICTKSDGAYRYDGNEFHHYDIPISTMGMMQDDKGTLWFAGAGGLYKMAKDGAIVNVKVDGPWE